MRSLIIRKALTTCRPEGFSNEVGERVRQCQGSEARIEPKTYVLGEFEVRAFRNVASSTTLALPVLALRRSSRYCHSTGMNARPYSRSQPHIPWQSLCSVLYLGPEPKLGGRSLSDHLFVSWNPLGFHSITPPTTSRPPH